MQYLGLLESRHLDGDVGSVRAYAHTGFAYSGASEASRVRLACRRICKNAFLIKDACLDQLLVQFFVLVELDAEYGCRDGLGICDRLDYRGRTSPAVARSIESLDCRHEVLVHDDSALLIEPRSGALVKVCLYALAHRADDCCGRHFGELACANR